MLNTLTYELYLQVVQFALPNGIAIRQRVNKSNGLASFEQGKIFSHSLGTNFRYLARDKNFSLSSLLESS